MLGYDYVRGGWQFARERSANDELWMYHIRKDFWAFKWLHTIKIDGEDGLKVASEEIWIKDFKNYPIKEDYLDEWEAGE